MANKKTNKKVIKEDSIKKVKENIKKDTKTTIKMNAETKRLLMLVSIIILPIIIVFGIIPKNKSYEYTCNDGYNLVDGKCIKEVESVDLNIEYSCEDGYELKDNNCVKYEYKDANTKWTCPSGYTNNPDKYGGLCYKETTIALSIQFYYCTSGYTLSGTKCTKTNISTASISYVCANNGVYYSSTGLCHLIGVYSVCPSGSWQSGGSGSYKTCVSRPFIDYTCPSGTTRKGTQCIGEPETIDAKYVRGCSGGYEINRETDTCTKTEYLSPSYQLYCDFGYELSNGMCVKTISENANQKKYCLDKYTMVSDKCVIYDEQELIKIAK